MIESLSHITLIVKDLEQMSGFLTTIFNAKEVYSSNGKEFSISREKFFLIGGIWIAIMQGDPLSEKSYNHIAFKIGKTEIDMYRKRIESLGVEMLKGRDRVQGEGQSLYFYDFDNHLFELHTQTLDNRLAAYDAQHPAPVSGRPGRESTAVLKHSGANTGKTDRKKTSRPCPNG